MEVRLYGKYGNGKTALVDPEDFERVNKYHWLVNKYGYALRTVYIKGTYRSKMIWLHREILKANPDRQVDHINGDRLDNRKNNLRECTNQQNQMNRGVSKSKKLTKYKGIYFAQKRWRVKIQVDGKSIHGGTFLEEITAARAYDKLALQYFGEFAHINL